MRHKTPTQQVEMLLNALFEGAAADEAWVDDRTVEWEMEELGYLEALEMPVPYQYALLTLASDRARAVARETLRLVQAAAMRLLATLELYEQERARHPAWAKFYALLHAPFPVARPAQADARDPDAVLLRMRDVFHDGSWAAMVAWIEQNGSTAQREALAHLGKLAAFEQAYHVDLSEVLFSVEARAEIARFVEQ